VSVHHMLADAAIQNVLTAVARRAVEARRDALFPTLMKRAKKPYVLATLRRLNDERIAMAKRFASFELDVEEDSRSAAQLALTLKWEDEDFFREPIRLLAQCRSLELLTLSYPKAVVQRAVKLETEAGLLYQKPA
jgi:hypothetical protein